MTPSTLDAAIATLSALPAPELKALVRARLAGAAAGLPLSPDEPPEDVFLAALERSRDDDFRARLRSAFAALLHEHVGELLRKQFLDSAPPSPSDAPLERLLLLVGLSQAREALPAIKAYLPAFSDGNSSLGQRLFSALASLAGPDDAALVPWLEDYAIHPQMCRLALTALWHVHRPSALSALPNVAEALGAGEESALSLARTLASLLGALADGEITQALNELEGRLAGAASPTAVVLLADALSNVPVLTDAQRRRTAAWREQSSRRVALSEPPLPSPLTAEIPVAAIGPRADPGGSPQVRLPVWSDETRVGAAMARTRRLVLSGVNGATGERLSAPLTLDGPPERPARVRRRRGVVAGVDAASLAQAGWGVVFAPDTPPEVEEALSPLLKHRQKQAGDLYRPLRFAPGDDVGRTFLERHKVGPGPVRPAELPYYLLLVGSPRSIPYRFERQLELQYAVGRLHFDHLDEYDAYARSVVAAERSAPAGSHAVALFGPSHAGDEGTRATHAELLLPLEKALGARPRGWRVTTAYGPKATKPALTRWLGGEDTPGVLFTAGHGLWFRSGQPGQEALQGALVCSDWPGDGPVAPDHVFAGDDLASSARADGLIAFFLGCYTIGTPDRESSLHLRGGPTEAAAPYPFVAALARRLLGRPHGALAVIGHVDAPMLTGFQWRGAASNIQVYESALRALMAGNPVGAATAAFAHRYAELATVLTDWLEPGHRRGVSEADLAALWYAHNDARAYGVFGDQAVRISVPHGRARRWRGVPPADAQAT